MITVYNQNTYEVQSFLTASIGIFIILTIVIEAIRSVWNALFEQSAR